jgi:hypothetical protein
MRGILSQRMAQLPDYRKGSNTQYSIEEAALGAFGIYFMQSPSFLDYQRHLQQTKGQNNACTLFGVEQIPCDNQIRNLLDPLPPSELNGVFLEVFESLDQHGVLANFRGLTDQLLIALDGTQYFSSTTLHCQNCLRRQTSKGQTLYYHTAITPVIVCPGRSEVIALPPEYIMPQDGHDKLDCERAAGKRWSLNFALFVVGRNGPNTSRSLLVWPCLRCQVPMLHAKSARPARTLAAVDSCAGIARSQHTPAGSFC